MRESPLIFLNLKLNQCSNSRSKGKGHQVQYCWLVNHQLWWENKPDRQPIIFRAIYSFNVEYITSHRIHYSRAALLLHWPKKQLCFLLRVASHRQDKSPIQRLCCMVYAVLTLDSPARHYHSVYVWMSRQDHGICMFLLHKPCKNGSCKSFLNFFLSFILLGAYQKLNVTYYTV